MAEEEKGGDATKAPKKVEEEKTVGKFTHGDHMVHILIQKGKKFISSCPDDRYLNLVIECEVDGQKQYSTSKDEVTTDSDSAIVWNEHIFFELKNLVSYSFLYYQF